MRLRNPRKAAIAALAAAAVTSALAATPVASAATDPNAFYRYTGKTPLSHYKPGAVLKTRALTYHVAGIALPLDVTQILYRTVDASGRPTANVTSVIKAPAATHPDRLVSYQSFYDSLNPADGPSRAIAGGVSFGGGIAYAETAFIVPFLLQGYSVNVPDTEGPAADFSVGPEYGRTTLDSLRAVSATSATGVAKTARIGLIGYSGGAIATGWAAALAPTYAPDVNRRLAGAAEGGVLVDPAHNLHYVSGTPVWAGVIPMSLIGASRGYRIDLTPYLNSYGKSVFAKLKDASISTVLGAYGGLTWAKLAKPQYADPEKVRLYVSTVNKLNLSTIGSPTTPMFIGQGANGILEGTPGTQQGIGAGDGVMVAGDVRSIARKYCASGTKVVFREYDATSHVTTVPLWLPEAVSWLGDRLNGAAAPQDCSQIAAGNPLTPLPTPKAH